MYLNKQWQEGDGGQLVLYCDEQDTKGIHIQPTFGTVVVFLSDEFPHEVLPSQRTRLSIAGCYRLNGSNRQQVDPPK